jgi:hypothetical protein
LEQSGQKIMKIYDGSFRWFTGDDGAPKRQIQDYPPEGDAVAIHGKEGEFQGVCKTG